MQNDTYILYTVNNIERLRLKHWLRVYPSSALFVDRIRNWHTNFTGRKSRAIFRLSIIFLSVHCVRIGRCKFGPLVISANCSKWNRPFRSDEICNVHVRICIDVPKNITMYACIFSFDDRSKSQRFLLKSAVAYRPKTDDLPYSSMHTSITSNHRALKSCLLFRYLRVHYTLRRCTKVLINNKRTTPSDLPEREGRRCWWDFDEIE